METLEELRNILLVHEIEVFKDHKNINDENIESAYQRVKCWKSLILEFGVAILYIKGEANVVANDFRRLPMVHNAYK